MFVIQEKAKQVGSGYLAFKWSGGITAASE